MQPDESPTIDDVLQDHAEAPAPAPAETNQQETASSPGITEVVQEDKAPEESLPDSSLIASRLNSLRQQSSETDQRRAQEQEYQRLQEEIRVLRSLHGREYNEQHQQTQERLEQNDTDQSPAMQKLRKEFEALRERADTYEQQLAAQQEQRELQEAEREVVQWVKEQKEHFPLINQIGQQGLVFLKMENERQRTGQYMSEAQASREVESELAAIIDRCAPLMGYKRSDAEPRREEKVSVGNSGMGNAEPLDLGSLSEDEALKALVQEYENTQR